MRPCTQRSRAPPIAGMASLEEAQQSKKVEKCFNLVVCCKRDETVLATADGHHSHSFAARGLDDQPWRCFLAPLLLAMGGAASVVDEAATVL